MVERKLEMESRPISALGPAPQQLKEGNFTQKKLGFLSFCYPTLSKDREEQNCPFWKGNIGMGQSGLCFIDTCLIILFPVSGTRRTFPEFQGRLVSRTALPDPACVHGCACSMCNSSRRTHTSRHTQTDIVHGQKTLRSFFFFKQGYSLLRIEPDSRTGAGCLGCKLNYFNAEKPFWRHRKFS